MGESEFRPSDVLLLALPLVGTMGRAEREYAAALVVRACQVLGDSWQPISPKQLGEVIAGDLAAKREPLTGLNRNPFLFPDFPDLIALGFVERTPEGQVAFTVKGLEALRRWVKPSEVRHG